MEDKDLNHEQFPLDEDQLDEDGKAFLEAEMRGGGMPIPADYTEPYRPTHLGVGIWNESDLDLTSYNSFGSRLTARITEILVDYHIKLRKPGNLEQEWENDNFVVILFPRHGGNCHTLIVQTKSENSLPLLGSASRRLFNALVEDGYTVTEADRKTGRQVPYTIRP